MASIRRSRTRNGEARYSVRWRDHDGREHERACGPRREDALRVKVEVERRLALGALYIARGTSFGAALDDFLERQAAHVRASTLRSLHSVARDAEPLRGLRVEDVGPDALARAVAAKARTAPTRADKLLKLVRAVLADCEQRGLTVDQRVRYVRRPRQPEPRRRYLEWFEVDALVAAAEHPDDAVAVLLGAACGLRWQEAFALTADDVRDGRVVVRRALGREREVGEVKSPSARRVVPIPEVAAERVAWAARRNPTGPLVPSGRGGWWHAAQWNRDRWTPIRDAAGVSCRFHDLRHTYAAHLVAAGVHPKAMQRLLGHATIGVTLDTYGHLLPEALDEAVAAFDRAVAERAGRMTL